MELNYLSIWDINHFTLQALVVFKKKLFELISLYELILVGGSITLLRLHNPTLIFWNLISQYSKWKNFRNCFFEFMPALMFSQKIPIKTLQFFIFYQENVDISQTCLWFYLHMVTKLAKNLRCYRNTHHFYWLFCIQFAFIRFFGSFTQSTQACLSLLWKRGK